MGLAAGLSLRRFGSCFGRTHFQFLVQKATMRQYILRVRRLNSVSIILSILHNHISFICYWSHINSEIKMVARQNTYLWMSTWLLTAKVSKLCFWLCLNRLFYVSKNWIHSFLKLLNTNSIYWPTTARNDTQ